MSILHAMGFNLAATIESGQVFRCHHSNGFFYVVVGGSIVKLQQNENSLFYECSNKNFDTNKFLGLNHGYSRILLSINKDEKIAAAIKKHYGLRILKQGLWECTASFICSSFSNIPRIRQCIEAVAAAFGNGIGFDGFKSFSFPQPQQINDFPKLKKCGLGYRAKYLFETARIFSSRGSEYSLHQLQKLGYAAAKEKLMELPGVGSKVADCVLLFSCGFFEAFPVDVWIQRAMANSYGSELSSFAASAGKKPRKITDAVVAEFARSYFGEYAGYAQQFLYHHSRIEGRGKRRIAALAVYNRNL